MCFGTNLITLSPFINQLRNVRNNKYVTRREDSNKVSSKTFRELKNPVRVRYWTFRHHTTIRAVLQPYAVRHVTISAAFVQRGPTWHNTLEKCARIYFHCSANPLKKKSIRGYSYRNNYTMTVWTRESFRWEVGTLGLYSAGEVTGSNFGADSGFSVLLYFPSQIMG